jgi:hypothetical protein
VARVELTRAAVEDLGRLVAVLTLPADTRERVRSRLQRLRELPRLGAELSRRWQDLCFVVSFSDRGDGCCWSTSTSRTMIAW